MSEPKHIKDSKQFTLVYPDVAEHLIEDNSRMEKVLGIVGNRQIVAIVKRVSVGYGINFMGLFFRQERRNDEEGEDKIESVEADIVAGLNGKDPIMLRLNSEDGLFKSGSEYGYGYCILLDTILNEENGYLEDEALTLQVEMRIHCLIGKDGFRRFNFYDPFENAVEFLDFEWDRPLYALKRIFLHHNSDQPFAERHVLIGHSKIHVELFLQILHGVRLRRFTPSEIQGVYSIAISFKIDNVIRFCETWLTRQNVFRVCAKHFSGTHSRCLLKWTLENPCDPREEPLEIAKALLGSDNAKTEHMKAVVKKLFSSA